jgi:hypothetical protein
MIVPRPPLLVILALLAVSTSVGQRPVRSTPEKLPPNFSGDDPATLLPQLIDLRKRLLKSEFETTAAYEARIVEEKKKPIMDRRTVQDTFYLVAHQVEAHYNADTQMMTFSLPVNSNLSAAAVSEEYKRDKKTMRDFSVGSMHDVSLGGANDPHVFFDAAVGLSGPTRDGRFLATATLDVEDAKRLKTTTKAVLAVRFEEPYATQVYSEGGQFLIRLLDLQFFDPQTGTVVAKIASTVAPDGATQSKDSHLAKAQELYRARRDEEALTELHRVVMDEPTSAEAYLLMGQVNVQRGDHEAAISALKTAVFWDPQLIDAHILLARIFLARNDRDEASKYVKLALAVDPNNQEALTLRRQISR